MKHEGSKSMDFIKRNYLAEFRVRNHITQGGLTT